MNYAVSNFPFNIRGGVKKFFLANMISLITTILSVLLAVQEVRGAFFSIVISASLLKTIILVSAIMGVFVILLQLIGVNQAARDEQYFHKALGALLVSLLCSIAYRLIPLDVNVLLVISLVAALASLYGTLCIIQGIRKTALRLKKLEMYMEGGWLYALTLIVTLCPIVIALLPLLMSLKRNLRATLSIVAMFAYIALVPLGIWFLVYLGRTVRMTNPSRVDVEDVNHFSELRVYNDPSQYDEKSI